MDVGWLYGLILVLIFFILYICFDINYFVTCILIVLWCKLRRKRVQVDDTTEFYGVCTTNDLDIYLQHMNNARYVRELDFARIHFYKMTGIFDMLWAQKGKALQTSTYARYRASLKLFTAYKIATRVMGIYFLVIKAAFWDEKCIYFEHKFIRLSDAFVTTVVFCKQAIVGVNVIEMMNKLLENRDEIFRPELPPELEEFINLDKKSSERLKKSNDSIKA